MTGSEHDGRSTCDRHTLPYGRLRFGRGDRLPLELIPGGPESIVTDVEASAFKVISSDLYISIHEPDGLSTIVACGEIGLGTNDQWR